MDASLDKFKEDVEKLNDALQMKHMWCGEALALSKLIDELKEKKDNAIAQADYWGDKIVKHHSEIEWE